MTEIPKMKEQFQKKTKQGNVNREHSNQPSPTLNDFALIDWRVPFDSLPPLAQELIVKIIHECHPSTLQVVLQEAHERELQDFRLWCLLDKTQRLIKLGNLMYTKRRGRAEWIV